MNLVPVLLIALLLTMPSARAVSWHTLKTDARMTLVADDPRVVVAERKAGETADQEKKKDRKLKLWHKTTYSQPQQAKPGDFFYLSSKSLTEVNCTTHATKPVERVFYGEDGGELKVIVYAETTAPVAVIPDTPDEWVFEYACNFVARAATPSTPAKTAAPPAKVAEKLPAKAADAAPKKDDQKKPAPPASPPAPSPTKKPPATEAKPPARPK